MPTLSGSQLPPPKNWQDFETLCCDLWKEIWGNPDVQKGGRQGQTQEGVDIFGRPHCGKKWAAIQCKGKDHFLDKRLTEKELQDAVREAKRFTPRLSQFVLATTGGRDTRIQALARDITDRHLKQRLFSVDVWSWHDISEELAKHPTVLAAHYSDLARVGVAILAIMHTASEGRLTDAITAEVANTDRLRHNVVRYATDFLLGSTGTLECAPPLVDTDGHRTPTRAVVTLPVRTTSMAPLFSRTGARKDRANTSVQLVPPSPMRALGILAVAAIPLTLPDLKRLFPDGDWDKHVNYLRNRKLVHRSRATGGIEVPNRIRQTLLTHKLDETRFRQHWIDALEPLKSHVDLALLLSVQYLSVGRLVEAVTVLTDLAPGLEPGGWNGVYCSSLLALAKPRILRLLTPGQRVQFLNAVGVCLSQSGDYRKAIEWFVRLRRYANRVRHNWGLGQSFINCGVAFAHLNDAPSAERCYLNAVAHARRTRDQHLLGRSLHNLAMTLYLRDAAHARRLLAQSEHVKRAVDDRHGLVATYLGYGILEGHAGNHVVAARWFRKAERTARQVDNRDARTLALYNLGLASLELGRYTQALSYYRNARLIAEQEGFSAWVINSLKGEGQAEEALKHYKRAEATFRHIGALANNPAHEDTVFALHAVGVMLLRQKRAAHARHLLKEASRRAKEGHLDNWVYRCLHDIALSYVEADADRLKAIRCLGRAASEQERAGSYSIAARLWENVYDLAIQHQCKGAEIRNGFERCLACLDKADTQPPMVFRVLGNYHSWKWRNGDFDGALATLQQLEARARRSGNHEWACRALDQTGACLQELKRFDEAEQHHRKALAVAQRKGYVKWMEHILNNLGELFRKQNHFKEALWALSKAESYARKRGDIEASVSVSHNRALVLEHQGRIKEAARLLRECLAVARRRGFWGEYVRALHGLANVAWVEKRARTAETLYAKALAEARRLKVTEHVCELSLNYSNALRWNGRPKRGITVLLAVVDKCAHLPDAHEYFIQLATLSQETGDLTRAKEYWGLARQHAARSGNHPAIALCSGALVELYQATHEGGRAEDELRVALEHETEPAPRMALLMQQLGLMLGRKAEKEASQVFSEIQERAEQHGLIDDWIDAFMMVGDYNWDESGGGWAGAKLYMAAMFKSLEHQNGERIWDVGTHFVKQLCQVETQASDRLQRRTQKWLVKSFGFESDAKGLTLALWPFGVAKRIAEEIGDWSAVSEKKYAEIVKAEISR